jgi:hypothetical protein
MNGMLQWQATTEGVAGWKHYVVSRRSSYAGSPLA